MNNNIVKSRKKSGIYQILNLKNNKVYIGQTNNLLYRRSQHFRSLKDNKHYNNYLQRALNKFGEKLFVFEVLEYCCTEELNVRERYWIEEKQGEYSDKGYNATYAVTLFNKYDNNRKVNISKRKPNLVNFTDDVKRKISESNKNRFWI